MKRLVYTVTDDIKDEDYTGRNSDLLNEVLAFIDGRTQKFRKFERGQFIYLEKHSIQNIINSYIRYFNKNVSDYGDGFAADWDEDDTMSILYKNGTVREVNQNIDDGTKKISVDNIDSIIINGGWGTAFAGPHITAEDYTVYDDIPDIRIEFDIY